MLIHLGQTQGQFEGQITMPSALLRYIIGMQHSLNKTVTTDKNLWRLRLSHVVSVCKNPH